MQSDELANDGGVAAPIGGLVGMDDTQAVAEIAHDMRTPLAIILGLCDRLEDGALDEQATQDVARLRANAERLARDFERLVEPLEAEAAEPPAPPEIVDLTALTWGVAADLRVLAHARGQRLKVTPAPSASVLGCEADLRSVVCNLLANALRWAPDGGLVRCSLSVRGNRVRLEIADDGPGIPDAERAAVLEPYTRGREAVEGDGGRGLGLSIVRRIVDEHHGRLEIGTAPEGGALLTVELPLLAASRGRRHRGARSSSPRAVGAARRRWL